MCILACAYTPTRPLPTLAATRNPPATAPAPSNPGPPVAPLDLCPDADETLNDYRDDDGCPDEQPIQKTNGDPNSGSSTKINACGHADHWNNWNWNEKTGVPASRGILPEGTGVEWRYITIDGAGAMVMLAKDDWVFVPSDCLSV
ncbi:MAG TPA: hypothetical protein VGB85_14460 [Nannocystis sp.]|jgi:hypothetical protein